MYFVAVCSGNKVVVGRANNEEEFMNRLKYWGYNVIDVYNIDKSLHSDILLFELRL